MPLPKTWQQQPGTDWQGFLRTYFRNQYQGAAGSKDFVPFTNLSALWWLNEEFFTVPSGTQDYTAAGTPSATVVSTGTGGQVQYTLAATNEIELYGVANSDNLTIRMDRPWFMMTRFQIPTAITTAQLFKIGACSSLASVSGDPLAASRYAYLSLSASMALYTQAYDGTTTKNDALDPAFTLTAATWYWGMVGQTDDGKLKYWLADSYGDNLREVGSYSMSYGSNNCQPVILIGKTGGVTQPSFIVDDLMVWGTRV